MANVALQGLAATMAVGNTTPGGGTDLLISAGDDLVGSTTSDLSFPGTGSFSERYGFGSLAAGAFTMAFGALSSAPGNNAIAFGPAAFAPGSSTTAVGGGAAGPGTVLGRLAASASVNNVAVGRIANASSVAGRATAIGSCSLASNSLATAIGFDASATGIASLALGPLSIAGDNSAIALGALAFSTAANQFVLGSKDAFITRMGLGQGIESDAPSALLTMHATDALAASGASGTNLTVRAGAKDGAGTEGTLTLQDTTTKFLAFHGAAGVAQQTVTGSRAGNVALADLLTKLAATGLIADGTSA